MGGAREARRGRAVAINIALLVVAFVVVAVLLVGDGGSPYTVKARFGSVSGAVKGGLVKVAGRKVGTIRSVQLSDDGQGELVLEIEDDDVAPLRRGTVAALRTPSLSSVAGKYVDLRIPPATAAEIPDGGVLTRIETSSAVDLDQFFSVFDDRTRRSLRRFIRGQARLTDGRAALANEGWRYLNPSLVASQKLFEELGGDRLVLERFLVDSSKLVQDLSARRDDVSELVDGLADTTSAIASRDDELSDAIGQLPPFLRRANTTFVNLRATVRDLDGLLSDTKPVTPKLRRTLAELRPFATESVPTLRDMARLTRTAGKGNDMVELLRAYPALRDIAVKEAERNGKRRPGSFPTSARAFREGAEPMSFFRPYAVDFTGWLDDFSHSGILDANGGASRVATTVSAFASVGGQLLPVPEELRDEVGNMVIRRGQRSRCPGSMERPAPDGSNPWKPHPDFNCDLTHVPVGK